MRTNDYLSNPVVPHGFYNVKCLAVATLPGQNLPTVITKLQIVPYHHYGDVSNTVLYVTLRGSANAQHMHEMFRQTFRIQGDPTEAIGRFGAVLVDEDEFGGKQYGGIHFIAQSEFARQQARVLDLADRDGEIPWADN